MKTHQSQFKRQSNVWRIRVKRPKKEQQQQEKNETTAKAEQNKQQSSWLKKLDDRIGTAQ